MYCIYECIDNEVRATCKLDFRFFFFLPRLSGMHFLPGAVLVIQSNLKNV